MKIDKEKKIVVYTKTESVVSDAEKRLLALANGKPAKTQDEKQMAADIQRIDKAGRILDIPSN